MRTRLRSLSRIPVGCRGGCGTPFLAWMGANKDVLQFRPARGNSLRGMMTSKEARD